MLLGIYKCRKRIILTPVGIKFIVSCLKMGNPSNKIAAEALLRGKNQTRGGVYRVSARSPAVLLLPLLMAVRCSDPLAQRDPGCPPVEERPVQLEDSGMVQGKPGCFVLNVRVFSKCLKLRGGVQADGALVGSELLFVALC